MNYRTLLTTPLLIAGLLLTACGPAATESEPSAATAPDAAVNAPAATGNTLTAIKVDAASTVADAAYWADAPALQVATVGATESAAAGPTVTLQAVYDANNFALRLEWVDTTESVLKNAWTWTDNAFGKSGEEDRVALLWPIGNNAEFATKGCSVACHNMAADESQWWMGSDSEDVRYDAWHWKAARTNPVGQADDKWWSVLADPTDVESSRRSDAKESGGYSDNVNEAKDGPAFIHSQDLSNLYLLTGEEVAIDMAQLSDGAIVPGYVLAPFVGSRGDVAANGTWSDGKWVVVLLRPLDTGHDDDMVLTPPKAYPFGLSVFDNGGGNDHTVGPDVLTLEWQ